VGACSSARSVQVFAVRTAHVLNDCRVRFSQRTVFEDDHELQPDYAIFGAASEIWQYAIRNRVPAIRRGGLPASVVVADLAANPKMQKMAIEAHGEGIAGHGHFPEFAGASFLELKSAHRPNLECEMGGFAEVRGEDTTCVAAGYGDGEKLETRKQKLEPEEVSTKSMGRKGGANPAPAGGARWRE
jgi:hypothetical protein